jgi:hypothetical protein
MAAAPYPAVEPATDAALAALLADAVLAVHLGIADYLTLGLPLVWLGAWRGWRFVRNPWLRWGHVAAMAVAALEAAVGRLCPLTEWEHALRMSAGQYVPHARGFLAGLVHDWFYWDVPLEIFRILYLAYFALIVLTLWLVPPRGRGKAP